MAAPAAPEGAAPGVTRPAPGDAVPGQAEERRQQRDRRHHHHQYDERDADPAGGDERDPGDGKSEDRHDHGPAGDDDRASGGGQCPADGPFDVVAVGEVLAVAGHHEQRVVDPDAQADHRADDRRPAGDVDDVGDQGQRAGADGQPDQCGPEQQAHRRQGPERQQQYDDRHHQPDRLADAGRGLLEGEEQVAACLDAQRRCGAEVVEQRLEAIQVGRVEVLDLGVLDPDQHHGSVRGDRSRPGALTRAQGADGVTGPLNVGQRRQRLLDPGHVVLECGRVEEARPRVARCQDHIGTDARLARPRPLHQLCRFVRVEAGCLERVVELTPEGR